MKDLYKDIRIVCKDEKIRASMCQNVRTLVEVVARNFKEGT
jgi:hypothetical protein